jgi:hypothetical protein
MMVWLESIKDATWVFGLDLVGILAAILAAVFSVWNWLIAKRRQLGNKLPRAEELSEESFSADAVLFTVSASELPILVIDSLKPKVVGFVHSKESYRHMEEIRTFARGAGIKVLPTNELDDIHDPNESRDAIAGLVQQAAKGKGRARVFVDITGGKTPMSVGAYQAAVESGATVMYVQTESTPVGDGWEVDKTTARIRRIHDPEGS